MDSENPPEIILERIISCLESIYGNTGWWPGNTDQVMIGSILTQQTRWENVEKALLNLDSAGIKTLDDVFAADTETVMDAVRCTGFYRIKTERLKELSSFVAGKGGTEALRGIPLDELRRELLDVKGVGAETADSILCYGLDMPSYVIDSYTERMTECAGITAKKDRLKDSFENVLPDSVEKYQSCHGWFVEYAKEYCIKKRCDECRIRNLD